MVSALRGATARRALVCAGLLVIAAAGTALAAGGFPAARLQAHVDWLAAPEREGRGFGSAGLEQSADYIEREFRAAGLEPGAGNGSYRQSWTSVGGKKNEPAVVHNLVGWIRGADPALAGEAVLVTSHYDHLGYGWPNPRIDYIGQLHPGADDNASGVALLLELAHALAAGPRPARSVVFVAFSDEEAGLRGSSHYVANPQPLPLAAISGVVNLDTVGRMHGEPLSVMGAESAAEWPALFTAAGATHGVDVRIVIGSPQTSDQYSFIKAGVPGVQLFTGAHADYHKPSDTPDRIDAAGLASIAAVTAEVLDRLLAGPRLTVAQVSADPTAGAAPGERAGWRRVSFGAVPDFGYQQPGLRLDGVVPGSPAERAGLQPGDVVTAIAGTEVRTIGNFNDVIRELSPGARVEVTWTRDGIRHSAAVELAAR